ncbi:hypothetical protein [Pyxidicoccus caerfyrddinensis]|uniref:hypothetical protein n=1 Tax=Pyxidicoccus caerfyrddinensis TaxID=2709663 RepID=UPI0013DC60F6|nr:hypothetical protein [Pyxidicoccus caerfyrddinensis]
MLKFNFSAIAIALLMAACGGAPSTQQEPREPQAGEGVLQLPLTSTTSEGQRYRLVGATFAITGPQSVNITDTSPDTVSVPLPAGAYSIRLEGQWHLERADAPGQSVQASLISPNPMAFSLDEGQARAVRFIFKVPGSATADVGISVDTAGWVTGTFDFAPNDPEGDPLNSLASLAGTSVPFVINWDTATVIRVNEGYPKAITVETGPITVQFGGAYSELLHDSLATSLQGAQARFSVLAMGGGLLAFSGVQFQFPGGQREPFNLSIGPSNGPFAGVVDENGLPAARPFDVQTPCYLSRSTPGLFGHVEGTARINVSAQ